jgi:hypothetical protein
MPASRSTTAAKVQPAKKSKAPPIEAPALRPRKGLFIVLLTIFVLWIGALVAMYFTTVRSHGGRLEPLPTTESLER